MLNPTIKSPSAIPNEIVIRKNSEHLLIMYENGTMAKYTVKKIKIAPEKIKISVPILSC
jgi:hypothetical protein